MGGSQPAGSPSTNIFHSSRSLLPIAAVSPPRRSPSALLIGGPRLEGSIIRQAAVNERMHSHRHRAHMCAQPHDYARCIPRYAPHRNDFENDESYHSKKSRRWPRHRFTGAGKAGKGEEIKRGSGGICAGHKFCTRASRPLRPKRIWLDEVAASPSEPGGENMGK
ncbi:hypothetical protein VTN31DRAFT_3419 [Thermomyces dupontii]|uniref:uncharacterized protein n=1 Tax=Talaromyces thermophilus TaxID=28565 RepID=UPI0037423C8B